MITYWCEDCKHFGSPGMGGEGTCYLDGHTTWSQCQPCKSFKRMRRCVVCGNPLTSVQRKYCSEECSKAEQKRERAELFHPSAPPKKSKGRKKQPSAVYGIREIVRIATAIADETGHMPSYGKVVADIDAGRIRNPEEYLRKRRKRT